MDDIIPQRHMPRTTNRTIRTTESLEKKKKKKLSS